MFWRVYTVLLVCMSGSVSLYTTCKDGWIAYRGSCYLFNMTPMQFTTAEQFCRQHDNSHLVHVDDATENSFLKDRMPMFKDFMPGDAGDLYTEDWALFSYGVQYRWIDFGCDTSRYVLCERRGHGVEEIVGWCATCTE